MTNENHRGLARTIADRDRWQGLIVHNSMQPPEKQNPLLAGMAQLMLEHTNKTIDCVETGKPFISVQVDMGEIYRAMGLHSVVAVDSILFGTLFGDFSDWEKMDRLLTIPDDICSVLKLHSYAIKAGTTPTPNAIIGHPMPCDAFTMAHQELSTDEYWGKVPIFTWDPPYGSSEEDIRYFAAQMKRA